MKNYLIILAGLLFFFSSCQSDSSSTTETKKEKKNLIAEAMADKSPKSYTLTPFTPSPGFEDASLYAMRFRNGKFEFTVGGDSYKLGAQTDDAPQKMCANSAKGQHIHLIVDNEPYAAKYTNEFEYPLADGDHYVLAFLSRSYHESIKRDNTHILLNVNVQGNTLKKSSPVHDPMVFYSRPKGTYTGKSNTEKVMLDFYLNNADFSLGYRVLADVNGERYLVDSWQPYYITGLPMGENSITLTLVDEDGEVVNSPLNPVTRKFTLEQDPLEVQN